MLTADVARLSPEARLLYWIRERHQIYLRRRAGRPKPWTDDVILQSYFFTNPYRENDKVTVWLRENIREPLRDSPAILFAVVAFRWFNWPETGAVLMGGGDNGQTDLLLEWNTVKAVNRLRSQGRVFTGAFNISNSGSTKPKINRVCEDYIEPVWNARHQLLDEISGAPLAQAFAALRRMPGLGGTGFMAAQVVCDLKYTALLENAEDWWTWCSPGPGSRRGLNRLLGKPVDAPLPKDWGEQINRIRGVCTRKLGPMPRLHAQDVQNCLCEYDKYTRALEGDGHMKRRYSGGGR